MSLEKGSSLNSSTSSTSTASDVNLERRQYGIWEAVYVKQGVLEFKAVYQEALLGGNVYIRLLREIYFMNPVAMILFLVSRFLESVEKALLLYFSSDLLRMIEIGLVEGKIDSQAVCSGVVKRLICGVFFAWFNWWVDSFKPVIKSQVINHYELQLMRARMQLDLSSSSQDPTKGSGAVTSESPWMSFESLVELIGYVVTFLSQILLLFHATKTSGGSIFVLLAVLQPFHQSLRDHNLWSRPLLVTLSNKYYQRMNALKGLTSEEYKHEYIAGNIHEYILQEYEKACNDLGNTPVDDMWAQVDRDALPYRKIGGAVLGDLPIAYCAWVAINTPSKLSLSSIAILQQSTNAIRWSMEALMFTFHNFGRNMSQLKRLYAALSLTPQLKEGELSYPRIDVANSDGMGIELRDIRFDYPSTQSTSSALKGVSLKIGPGRIVVVVGTNASGKSTLVKLITRMYDATSGTLLIDGLPASDYRATDLRQTIASFSQDHKLFPLSLCENIGIGDHSRIQDKESILEAAQLGGALELITKLEDGIDSVLDPMDESFLLNVPPQDNDHPLRKEMVRIHKKVDISGGERQRVVAARTFMHIGSGKVKLVAVDEPSSALDSEAELALFQRLIDAREGKTMIFVTHRFGHLTKHADMIVCMKEGNIVETGSHKELMELDGEYAKLYNIQAKAFVDNMKQ